MLNNTRNFGLQHRRAFAEHKPFIFSTLRRTGDYLPFVTGLAGAGTSWALGGDPIGGFFQGYGTVSKLGVSTQRTESGRNAFAEISFSS